MLFEIREWLWLTWGTWCQLFYRKWCSETTSEIVNLKIPWSVSACLVTDFIDGQQSVKGQRSTVKVSRLSVIITIKLLHQQQQHFHLNSQGDSNSNITFTWSTRTLKVNQWSDDLMKQYLSIIVSNSDSEVEATSSTRCCTSATSTATATAHRPPATALHFP